MIQRIAAAAAILVAALAPARAGAFPEAEAFVVELVTELRANAEEFGEGSQAVRATLEENLAAEAIGNFLVRGKAADAMTPEERARYDVLFPKYIAAAYAEEIGQLTAREIVVEDSLEIPNGDIIVQSILNNREGIKKADIDWRVREIDGAYRLVDVLVERTSPLITRRQTFSTIFRDEGLEGLFAHMEAVSEAGSVDAVEGGA